MYSLAFFIALMFDSAKELSLSHKYEESQLVLSLLDESKVEDPVEYHFYKFVNAFKLLDKKTAEKEAEFFEDCFLPIAKRHKDVAFLMSLDLKMWKERDLGDISRQMKKVSNRLENAKAGPETRKLQKNILKNLDELIAQIEKQKADQEQKMKQDAESKQNKSDIKPLDDSLLPQGKADGIIDMKKFKEYAEVWGKLPEKERAKAMNDLARTFPPKYRAAIESYFKNLESKKK